MIKQLFAKVASLLFLGQNMFGSNVEALAKPEHVFMRLH